MPYWIRLVQLVKVESEKPWYSPYVGNYYAVHAEPFADSDPYFSGSYLTYKGVETSVSTRIHKSNVNVLSLPFWSNELDEKTKELGIELKHNYAENLQFVVIDGIAGQPVENLEPYSFYPEAYAYITANPHCYIETQTKKEREHV